MIGLNHEAFARQILGDRQAGLWVALLKGADGMGDKLVQIHWAAGLRDIGATCAFKGQKLIGQIAGLARGLQELSAALLRGLRVWCCGDRFGQRKNPGHGVAQLMGRVRDKFIL